ncbi:MAG: hypothetical protein ACXVCS_18545 [Bdellovibrionota bacterium]
MRFLFLLSLLASPAFAAPLSIKCDTDMPTTIFDFSEQGDQYLLKVKQVNGVAFMPIHEGVIVPHDFPYLQSKANMLTRLSDYVEFHFPKDKCTIHGKGLISCGDGERKKFGDIEMQALNFYTGKVHEDTMGLSLDSWKVTLSIWSPDFTPVMDMTMVYGDTNCKFWGF